MKKSTFILAVLLGMAAPLAAQVEPGAGSWRTWFITNGQAYRLPPPAYTKEIKQVLAKQQEMDAAGLQQVLYWNAGAPGYRWQEMMGKLWQADTSYNGVLAHMLLGVAIYDATIAAWHTKYAYKSPRPYTADKRVKLYVPRPGSPSYPCEHSVAAGVAATIIAHFYPSLADSVNRLAQQAMVSRVAAGAAFPADTRAGFELGARIAKEEIERTKHFTAHGAWDGTVPQGAGYWKGNYAAFPLAGANKTVVLTSGSRFRPAPPPDFAKDMAELKNFKQTFRSQSNAFHFANQGEDVLGKKIFEYNLHLNPPRAARLYAIAAIGTYDGFVACWDAKYAYWGIRPNQYDTAYRPLLPTPPFPGYPSGHAMIGSVSAGLYTYFFPADKAYFNKRAKDGAESRFQGGIHFRSDNEVGLEMGRKVAAAIIEKVKTDGAGEGPLIYSKKSGQ